MREKAKDLRSIYIRWAWPDPATDGWRAKGNQARFWSLAALGTHCIDLALFFTRGPPTRIVSVREPSDGVDRAAEQLAAFAAMKGFIEDPSLLHNLDVLDRA
jgi:predicted dehydrogenase